MKFILINLKRQFYLEQLKKDLLKLLVYYYQGQILMLTQDQFQKNYLINIISKSIFINIIQINCFYKVSNFDLK